MSINQLLLLICCVSILGCTSESNRTKERVKSDQSVIKSKTSGVVYKPSELAEIMRGMYNNMSTVGKLVNSEQEIPDSLLLGYEAMLNAKATNPEEINEQFYGFANIWLAELKGFRETKDIKSYNSVMNACVNCHQSFCPGPISKIKKLKLVP